MQHLCHCEEIRKEAPKSNYCHCKYCRYVNSGERSGYKWYCEWYRIYVDPDELTECSHYQG